MSGREVVAGEVPGLYRGGLFVAQESGSSRGRGPGESGGRTGHEDADGWVSVAQGLGLFDRHPEAVDNLLNAVGGWCEMPILPPGEALPRDSQPLRCLRDVESRALSGCP